MAAFRDDSSRRSKGQFRRGGTSLYKTLPISLSDALLGFERNLTHMDGRTVTVKRDGVTQTGFVSVVDNEGMPVQGTTLSEASDDEMRAGRDMLFGKLYIEWQLVLPETVDPALRKGEHNDTIPTMTISQLADAPFRSAFFFASPRSGVWSHWRSVRICIRHSCAFGALRSGAGASDDLEWLQFAGFGHDFSCNRCRDIISEDFQDGLRRLVWRAIGRDTSVVKLGSLSSRVPC